MKAITLTVLAAALLASCTASRPDIAPSWLDVQESDVCMPGGGMWFEHEVGTTRHQEMYAAIIRFKEIPPDQTVPFLISRLDSTEDTTVHICPFSYATEGELAVYLLANITGQPWFKAMGLSRQPDNARSHVLAALRDPVKRQQLADFYAVYQIAP